MGKKSVRRTVNIHGTDHEYFLSPEENDTLDDIMQRTVCVGVLNPKGEPDDRLTTYFTESQLKKLESRINDKRYKRLPVYLDHMTHTDDGKELDPSGYVHYAELKPDGRLCVAVIINRSVSGQIAEKLLGDSDKNGARHFSLGYDVLMRPDENGFPIPIDKFAKEVSICFLGAREGTYISHVCKFQDLLQTAKSGEAANLNNNEQASIPNFNQQPGGEGGQVISATASYLARPPSIVDDVIMDYQMPSFDDERDTRIKADHYISKYGAVVIERDILQKCAAAPTFGEVLRRHAMSVEESKRSSAPMMVSAIASAQVPAQEEQKAPPPKEDEDPMPAIAKQIAEFVAKMDGGANNKKQMDEDTKAAIQSLKSIIPSAPTGAPTDVTVSLGANNDWDPELAQEYEAAISKRPSKEDIEKMPENIRAVCEAHAKQQDDDFRARNEKFQTQKKERQGKLNEGLKELLQGWQGTMASQPGGKFKNQDDINNVARVANAMVSFQNGSESGIHDLIAATASVQKNARERTTTVANQLEERWQQQFKERAEEQALQAELLKKSQQAITDLHGTVRDLRSQLESVKSYAPIGASPADRVMATTASSAEPIIKRARAAEAAYAQKNEPPFSVENLTPMGKMALWASLATAKSMPYEFNKRQAKLYNDLDLLHGPARNTLAFDDLRKSTLLQKDMIPEPAAATSSGSATSVPASYY